MEASAAFLQALVEGSVRDIRALWRVVCPHLPQPRDDQEAALMMHRARTDANSIPLKERAYSHRWLTERGLPSGLPDHLRSRAERMYPVVIDAVGIAVRSGRNPEAAKEVRGVMENAVREMYADGDKDPQRIKKRIMEVGDIAWREAEGAVALARRRG